MVVEEKEGTVFVAESLSELAAQTKQRMAKILRFCLFYFSLKNCVVY